MIRIAINGFGRIGRAFLRCILQDKNNLSMIEVVAINVGNSAIENTAHMFKYDTLMGTLLSSISMDQDNLIVDGYSISVIAELDPEKLPWGELSVDWVVDCTGKFTDRSGAQKHITAGARSVLISAPAHDEDIAIIPGVNQEMFDAHRHAIVSLGSCTTNALMTTLKVLHDAFGIESGFMTTTHAYTNSQVLLDVDAKDLRFSRAAALNMIPSTTGASKMLAKIIPDLADKISAVAIRVPIGKVSLIDLVFQTKKNISVSKVHEAFIHASNNRMKNIVAITDEPLVSSDFSGNHNSVIIDALLTNAHGRSGQVFGWYDNEWGYSMRLRDFLLYVS